LLIVPERRDSMLGDDNLTGVGCGKVTFDRPPIAPDRPLLPKFTGGYMYPFPQSVTPAVRDHLGAQMSLINDMSKSLFSSIQQLYGLNIQLTQTMLEESVLASKELLTADKPTEIFSAVASRAQPAVEKLRAYQQHLARVAADTEVQLVNVAEQHLPETTRAAKTLADEVARMATDETEKSLRKQEDTIRTFSDPFTAKPNGGAKAGDGGATRGSANPPSGAQAASARK
jgi:phasin family protein